jgi:flavorubredoxin
MAKVTEVAPDIYRISIHVSAFDLQFNQFLVKDEEPVLFHTGLKAMFPEVREAVASVLDPAGLRWIAFSHFESDECGALNLWLETAPHAEPACTMVGKAVSVDDFATRPARGFADQEVFTTGQRRLRFLQTPHLPHAWDAGLLFEETTATLLCSDLLHQGGDVEPIIESDVVPRTREALMAFERGPLARCMPWTPYTEALVLELADLKPKACATMHGSTFRGDGARALRDLAVVLREVGGGAPA